MKCYLESGALQQLKGDRFVYLPIIYRCDKGSITPVDDLKIIRIAGARQYRSLLAAEKFAAKALRKLWRTLMKSRR
jgi:hypothetical protein